MPQSIVSHSQPTAADDALIEQIGQSVLRDMNQLYPASVTPVHRQAHPKTHACVRAQFHVAPDLPDELKQGVFREERSYDAWVRFSSGAPKMQNDRRPDIHGMAIKLLGVTGEKLLEDERDAPTQDFVLANHRVFFIRTVNDYAAFAAAIADHTLPRFFLGRDPRKWRLREMRLLLGGLLRRVTNPLQTQYWSQTPYQFGPHEIKFSARPQPRPHRPTRAPDRQAPLQSTMAAVLQAMDVQFDFLVQLRTHPDKMPLEDSTVAWSESLSPPRKVATLTIPSQTFTSPAQLEFAEHLSYTPWHSLPEHRPLGAINDVRRSVYQQLSLVRHERNAVPRQEPTSLELPNAESAP